MKKLLIVFLCFVLVFSFAACGEKENGEKPENNGTEQPSADEKAPDTYVASVNGTDVWVKADMAQIKAKLGEPTNYFESESCAFQGLDKVYTYGSVIIRTYPEGQKDFVLNIELKDDTVTTKEGVFIGSTKEEVVAAYGAAAEDSDTALSYKKNGTALTFLLTNGSVTAITYTIAD